METYCHSHSGSWLLKREEYQEMGDLAWANAAILTLFPQSFSVMPSGHAALSSAHALATLLLQYHSARMLTLKQAQPTATLVKHWPKN